jgi:hypothetical protein
VERERRHRQRRLSCSQTRCAINALKRPVRIPSSHTSPVRLSMTTHTTIRNSRSGARQLVRRDTAESGCARRETGGRFSTEKKGLNLERAQRGAADGEAVIQMHKFEVGQLVQFNPDRGERTTAPRGCESAAWGFGTCEIQTRRSNEAPNSKEEVAAMDQGGCPDAEGHGAREDEDNRNRS